MYLNSFYLAELQEAFLEFHSQKKTKFSMCNTLPSLSETGISELVLRLTCHVW